MSLTVTDKRAMGTISHHIDNSRGYFVKFARVDGENLVLNWAYLVTGEWAELLRPHLYSRVYTEMAKPEPQGLGEERARTFKEARETLSPHKVDSIVLLHFSVAGQNCLAHHNAMSSL